MTTMTFHNSTGEDAQFFVYKGEQQIARLPGLKTNQKLEIPTTDTYDVVASTVLHNNTYTSEAMVLHGGKKFLAQVLQEANTFVFNVQELASSSNDTMEFENTGPSPVTFHLRKNGKRLQSVVCDNHYDLKSLQLSDRFTIQAIVAGITTAEVETNDPSATVLVQRTTSDAEAGGYELVLS